ncbi:hypothetical protein DFJ74DRAFT_650191 [Hyaloraphidium curvatum]|nr:hypothetical protein DFJ74DRAFT_650191 [Hyaloraphidium curvatum]
MAAQTPSESEHAAATPPPAPPAPPAPPLLPLELLLCVMRALASRCRRASLLRVASSCRAAWEVGRAVLHRTLDVGRSNAAIVGQMLARPLPEKPPRILHILLDSDLLAEGPKHFRGLNFGSPWLDPVRSVTVLLPRGHLPRDLPTALSRFPRAVFDCPEPLAVYTILACCTAPVVVLRAPRCAAKEGGVLAVFCERRKEGSRVLVEDLGDVGGCGVDELAGMWGMLTGVTVVRDGSCY